MLIPDRDVTHVVADERHVLDHGPRRAAVLIAHGEEDRKPALGVRPVVLEEIALDQHAPGILQLEDVLHGPRRAGVGRIADPPRPRLREVIAPDFDVRRHEVRNRRIGAAEQHVLAGAFKVVVDDLEGAGTAPAGEGLRVGADLLAIRDVRVDDGRGPRVQRNRAPEATLGIAVQVGPIEDQVVRQRRVGLRRAAQVDELIQKHVGTRANLDADEAIVVRAGRRRDHGAGRGHERRHDMRVRGIDPLALAAAGRRRVRWCE